MRASQFVLKLAHLAISMKPRVPRGLRSPTPIMAPTNTSKRYLLAIRLSGLLVARERRWQTLNFAISPKTI